MRRGRRKAVRIFGYSRRRWNKPRIIREIQQLEEVYSTWVKKNNNALWKAAVRYFGSWMEAVEAAGFEYSKVRRKGPTKPPPNKGVGGNCSEHGCDEPHHAKGLCKRHYTIKRRKNVRRNA